MKGLVLAAGRGTRLGATAGGVPKPLVDLGGTTPLEHTLDRLAAERLERIWVNVHAGADVIRARVGDAVNGVPISYSYEPELLGTAGAWKKLEAEWSETSFVIYGDNLLRFDMPALLASHRAAGALMTIAVFDPERTTHTGIAGGRARVADGRAIEFVEGGGAGMINAGVYCIEPALCERLQPGFTDFGHDVLPQLASAGELAAHVLEDGAWCLGVDTPDRLERARALLQLRAGVAQ